MAKIIIQIQDRCVDGSINELYVTQVTLDQDGLVTFQTGPRSEARVLNQGSHLETIKKIADMVFDFMLIPEEQTYVGMRLIEV